MNHIFRLFIDKFTVVYLDDILVYSYNLREHLLHLRQILETLKCHQLYLNPSKCTFARTKVEFLSHVIGGEKVQMDHKKLRSFIGLTNYYRKFIKSFSHIATPLTQLLKKDQR
ncbi:unnamed protein product [Spirodela intermedia]|uniref:Reverse transcriptase domain-containing protein n=2 Tax=Spirodela intermedia TaxID=51605 RepID=A0A7I8J050_SPIIN|nr:unnamed protein product [Spirodela intermedia]CAA6662801.1 unnamed protein product [Spirodela intermedia]CAA7399214.1 unnamed protein product [Spirodela intermedia]